MTEERSTARRVRCTLNHSASLHTVFAQLNGLVLENRKCDGCEAIWVLAERPSTRQSRDLGTCCSSSSAVRTVSSPRRCSIPSKALNCDDPQRKDPVMPRSIGEHIDITRRNNIRILGRGDLPIVFAHGFGCDQNMWRLVVPAFEDPIASCCSTTSAPGSPTLRPTIARNTRRSTATPPTSSRFAASCSSRDVIFVGHSVSAMIGVLAANREPDRFKALVLIGPSPRYIDDADYVGDSRDRTSKGCSSSLDSNYLGWSSSMAPVIMGNADRPELGAGANEQLLPDRPRHCVTFRARHVPLRQSAGPRRRSRCPR